MEGDRNTSYLQRTIKVRRRSDRIFSLRNDVGETISDPNDLAKLISNYFVDLFTTAKHVSIKDWDPPLLTGSLLTANFPYVSRPPTLDDIKEV